MHKPKQTRRQFLKEFVGPPRRPWTPEERATAMAAYQRAMDEWRAQCGDLAKRKNNFHRIADAEQHRSGAVASERDGGPSVGHSTGSPSQYRGSDLDVRRTAALRAGEALCAVMRPPTRVALGSF